MAFYYPQQEQKIIATQVTHETRHFALSIAEYENQIHRQTHSTLSALSRSPFASNALHQDCAQDLQEIVGDDYAWIRYLLIRADGEVLCASDSREIGSNYSSTAWYPSIQTSHNRFSIPYQIYSADQIIAIDSTPIRDGQGAVWGHWVAEVSLSWLPVYTARLHIPPTFEVRAYSPSGILLARHPGAPDAEDQLFQSFDWEISRAPTGEQVFEQNDEDRYIAWSQNDDEFIALVIANQKPIQLINSVNLQINLAILALVVLMSTAVALPASRFSILNPTQSILRALNRIREGDLSARISTPRGGKELINIAEEVNRLAAELEYAQYEQELNLAALSASEARYRTISELISDYAYGIIVHPDQSLELEWVTAAFKRITGYTFEDCSKLPLAHFVYFEDQPLFWSALNKILSGEKVVTEYRIVSQDGAIRWMRDHAHPEMDPLTQKVTKILGGVKDITEYRLASLEVRERVALEKSLLNASPDPAFLIDQNGAFEAVNTALSALLRKSPEELIGSAIWDSIQLETIDWKNRIIPDTLRAGQPIRFTEEYHGFYFDHSIYPVHGNTGVIQRLAVFMRDITQRKKAEEALVESEQRYRSMFYTNPSIMLLIDPQTLDILDANPSACQYYGYSLERITQMKINQINTLDIEDLQTEISKAVAGTPRRFLFKHRLSNGLLRDVEVSTGPLRIGGKNALFSIVHDVTNQRQAEDKLRSSLELMQTTLAGLTEAVLIISPQTRVITDCNPATEVIFGRIREEIIGQAVEQIHISPENRQWFGAIETALQLEGFISTEVELLRANGDSFPAEVYITHLTKQTGQVEAWVAVIRDITVRKKAEQALRESEYRYRTLIEQAPVGIALGKNNKHEYANKIFLNLFGITSQEELARLQDIDLVAPQDHHILLNAIKRWRNNELIEPIYSVTGQRQDGSTFPMEVQISWLKQSDGYSYIKFISDITGRKQAEQDRDNFLRQIRAAGDKLRLLSQRVISAQEEERQRLSRELHDDAGQELTALKISLQLLQANIKSTTPDLAEMFEEAIQVTDNTMEHIRQLAHDLRPPSLDALGLSPTLEGLCAQFSRRTHIQVQYHSDQTPEVHGAISITLYRVLQEALTNIARHASATRVQVNLLYENHLLTLEVQDNGAGFTPSNPSTGIGLIGIQERLEMLGGILAVYSTPGQGACVVASIPLEF